MNTSRFKTSLCRFVAGVLALTATFSMVAHAQPSAPPTPAQTPAAIDGFLPMSAAAPREVLPATPLVFFAYAFVWVALIGYIAMLWFRMGRVEEDLIAVQKRLKDGAGRR